VPQCKSAADIAGRAHPPFPQGSSGSSFASSYRSSLHCSFGSSLRSSLRSTFRCVFRRFLRRTLRSSFRRTSRCSCRSSLGNSRRNSLGSSQGSSFRSSLRCYFGCSFGCCPLSDPYPWILYSRLPRNLPTSRALGPTVGTRKTASLFNGFSPHDASGIVCGLTDYPLFRMSGTTTRPCSPRTTCQESCSFSLPPRISPHARGRRMEE
jgi:hypothetical protein